MGIQNTDANVTFDDALEYLEGDSETETQAEVDNKTVETTVNENNGTPFLHFT